MEESLGYLKARGFPSVLLSQLQMAGEGRKEKKIKKKHLGCELERIKVFTRLAAYKNARSAIGHAPGHLSGHSIRVRFGSSQ